VKDRTPFNPEIVWIVGLRAGVVGAQIVKWLLAVSAIEINEHGNAPNLSMQNNCVKITRSPCGNLSASALLDSTTL
jgi:hypothetical protein